MILEVRACFTSELTHPPQTMTNRTIRHFAEALTNDRKRRGFRLATEFTAEPDHRGNPGAGGADRINSGSRDSSERSANFSPRHLNSEGRP
ncbi:hypothetical protein OG906_40555 (plasmid) [Streptomyces sp. NBC_01426]|uniref:hypothetical protein n=1 Tax=Streptomyces sp. NBC_01426 TaxID=2975866 RepID=UPI002E33A5A3|nr:hypothetical protein [Streptomyces sp. NBC_01426]